MSKPLYQKLGIKEGFKTAAIASPVDYNKLTGTGQKINHFVSYADLQDQNYDLIHIFTNDITEVENSMLYLKSKIKQNGMIWYSWYKKSSKKQRGVNEDIIRDTALGMNLVDVKVCSVDPEWSALKIVIPLIHRHSKL